MLAHAVFQIQQTREQARSAGEIPILRGILNLIVATLHFQILTAATPFGSAWVPGSPLRHRQQRPGGRDLAVTPL